jgi:phosphoribosylformylglycinamidine (FGAM) synthase-like enzyme
MWLCKRTSCRTFAQKSADKPDFSKEFDSVISLKAETHNFPTTVEPLTELQPVQVEKFVIV